MLFGSWILQLGDDLRSDEVVLSEVSEGTKREEWSCIQNEVLASRLKTRLSHLRFKARGRYLFDRLIKKSVDHPHLRLQAHGAKAQGG